MNHLCVKLGEFTPTANQNIYITWNNNMSGRLIDNTTTLGISWQLLYRSYCVSFHGSFKPFGILWDEVHEVLL